MYHDLNIKLSKRWGPVMSIYRNGDTIIPNYILDGDVKLSPKANKLILFLLHCCQLNDSLSYQTTASKIAHDTHMRTNQIQSAIRELHRKGVITSIRIGDAPITTILIDIEQKDRFGEGGEK
jgi:hypothetical protein